MAINWPTGPSVGQFYPTTVTPGDPQWKWNGEGWERVINAGQVVTVLIILNPVVETTVEALAFVSNTIHSFTYL